jgi:hypothetical protein
MKLLSIMPTIENRVSCHFCPSLMLKESSPVRVQAGGGGASSFQLMSAPGSGKKAIRMLKIEASLSPPPPPNTRISYIRTRCKTKIDCNDVKNGVAISTKEIIGVYCRTSDAAAGYWSRQPGISLTAPPTHCFQFQEIKALELLTSAQNGRVA